MMVDVNTLDFKYSNDSTFKAAVDANFGILKDKFPNFGSDEHTADLIENFITMYAGQEPSAFTDDFFHRSVKSYIKMQAPRIGNLFEALQFKYDETLKQITQSEATVSGNTSSTTKNDNATATTTTSDGRVTKVANESTVNANNKGETTNTLTDGSVHTNISQNTTSGTNNSTVTDNGTSGSNVTGNTSSNDTTKKYTAVDVAASGSGFDSDGTLIDSKEVASGSGTNGSNTTGETSDKSVTSGGNSSQTNVEDTTSVKGDVVNDTNTSGYTGTNTTGDNTTSVTGDLTVKADGGTSSATQSGTNGSNTQDSTTLEGLNILKSDAYNKFYQAYSNLDWEFLEGMSYLFVRY